MLGMMLRNFLPLVVVLAGCRNMDEAGAEALWDEVHAAEYRAWERAPGWPERVPSGAPHGEDVDIYVNDVVVEALASETALTEWPVGSIIVKDGWVGEDLKLVAIMEKREGEWFFAEYGAEGSVDFSGQPGICTRCHDAGADYVRAFGLPQ
jgi:hypothetical protein